MKPDLLAAFRETVGNAHVLTGDTMAPHLTDWRRRYTGSAQAVVQPASTDEVARIVRLCVDARVPIVPQGGNTGLAGGATPDASGQAIVLNLCRMQGIRTIDTANNTLTAEAGCILAQVQDAARNAGRLFPLSLAAEGSCTLGGNLSTNAGGTAVLRYGNARELCLGIEVVTAAGDVIDMLRGLRKDNTGYDLRDLFIGAEGTLGIITAAVMKLYPLPRTTLTALVALDNPHQAVALLNLAQTHCGPELTAFELMSDFALTLVEKHFPPHRLPLESSPGSSPDSPPGSSQRQRPPYVVLLELSSLDDEAPARARLEGLLEAASLAGLARNAALSVNLAQSRAMWEMRELISEAQAREGKNIKHDIAVPVSGIADFIEATQAQLQRNFPGVRLVNFGHLGDGNLHFNVSPPENQSGAQHEAEFLARQPDINRVVHDSVAAHGGSISAEHGLGQLRREEIRRYKPEAELALMRAVKQALDPHNLMNPGKVL